MVKKLLLSAIAMLSLPLVAQELLLPLQHAARWQAEAKTSADTLQLPFFDDFSYYQGSPDSRRWAQGGGFVQPGNGELPPTVGMLTLDALDAEGHLYPAATTSTFDADTISSLPISLQGLTKADSLVLSFYYLPGGGYGNEWERIGDMPETDDSLMLDFYDGTADMWRTVWRRSGISVDSLLAQSGTTWQYVAIKIEDEAYFNSGIFRFRFRNRCSINPMLTTVAGRAADCDQWHLDYIWLDTARSILPNHSLHDVAFVAPAPSMLAHYTAMPAWQYRVQDMASEVVLTAVNLSSAPLATHFTYTISDTLGQELYHYDGGYENAPSFPQSSTYLMPSVRPTYAFPEGASKRQYEVTYIVKEGTGGDSHPANDTVRFLQTFAEYYAYDDGTSEEGYGLYSTASRVYVACRFTLNAEDTLGAVDLYFNATYNHGNEHIPFYLTVWSVGDDGKPADVLYRDTEARYVAFDGLNRYCRYRLEKPIKVRGNIFVGFEQGSNDYINLGFDRSHNNADKVCYLTDTQWKHSLLSGTLMIRPCLGSESSLAITSAKPTLQLEIYPNPSSHWLTVVLPTPIADAYTLTLYNPMGQAVMRQKVPQGTFEATLDVSSLPTGTYLLQATTLSNSGITHFIIQR